jgi:hypothetical protein
VRHYCSIRKTVLQQLYTNGHYPVTERQMRELAVPHGLGGDSVLLYSLEETKKDDGRMLFMFRVNGTKHISCTTQKREACYTTISTITANLQSAIRSMSNHPLDVHEFVRRYPMVAFWLATVLPTLTYLPAHVKDALANVNAYVLPTWDMVETVMVKLRKMSMPGAATASKQHSVLHWLGGVTDLNAVRLLSGIAENLS